MDLDALRGQSIETTKDCSKYGTSQDGKSMPPVQSCERDKDHDARNCVPRSVYDELKADFDSLRASFGTLSDAHSHLSSRYRREKTNIKAWQKYMELHPKEGARKSTEPDPLTGKRMRNEDYEKLDQPSIRDPQLSLQPDYLINEQALSEQETVSAPPFTPFLPSPPEASVARDAQLDQPQRSFFPSKCSVGETDPPLILRTDQELDLSQTTDGGEAQATTLPKENPHSAEVRDKAQIVSHILPEVSQASIITSERPVKRRRRGSKSDLNSFLNDGDENAFRTVEVKGESLDIVTIEFGGEAGESLDLDEIGRSVDTPKKHQRFREWLRNSQPKNEGVNSSADALEQVGDRKNPKGMRLPKMETPKVSVFAEDGEDYRFTVPAGKTLSSLDDPGEVTSLRLLGEKRSFEINLEHNRKLQGLLEDYTPSKCPLPIAQASFRTPLSAIRPIPRNAKVDTEPRVLSMAQKAVKPTPATEVVAIHQPNAPETFLKRSWTPQTPKTMNTWKQSGHLRDPSPLDRPDSTPLRVQPITRLRLDDFKVNPGFNQGLNFAFTETVRKREQRKCLPGCIRSECCGFTLRKVVEIGGLPTPPQTGLRWDSSQEEDEEQGLLEWFLESDKGRIQSMSVKERSDMLILAKTKRFANEHGRHRNAFERPKSPPGFWRTDMPTTQELEEDREEARRLEREKLEERWREAMKEDGKGRWKFRDE